MLIVDAHEDLAWNMLTYGRDYTRPVAETRRLEAGGPFVAHNDDTLLGYPEYRRGRVALVFATLFAEPLRAVDSPLVTQFYSDPRQAHTLLQRQLDVYERLADQHPDHFRLIRGRNELESAVQAWTDFDRRASRRPAEPPEQALEKQARRSRGEPPGADDPAEPDPAGPPVGLVISMEGADAIREPAEVEAWWQRGVRLVGPAWRSTAYCGGTREPGPLTRLGFELLERMAGLNMGLDLTHMDETAARQALDAYPGTLLASHSNALALLKVDSNRHLTDRVIAGIIERDGVIGIVPFIAFLKGGWKRGDRREDGSLAQMVAQIDYICQMAGDARHVGLGTDFDGGFGLQSVPPELDSIADLPKLAALLAEKGYTEGDLAAIFGENWLNLLRRILP